MMAGPPLRLNIDPEATPISAYKAASGHVHWEATVKEHLRYLSRDESGGVLGLNDITPKSQGLTTRDVLRDKHPPGKPPCPDSLLPDSCESINPIIYSSLDAECILRAALHTQGAAGLSGLDAFAWRRMCSSFKSASHDLCHALAGAGLRICTSNIHSDDLSAFVVHAVRHSFEEQDVQEALLVDAFNTINRQAALHNIKSICLPLFLTPSTSSSTERTTMESHAVKLPMIDVPTFNGELLHWQTFWEQFNISVDSRSDKRNWCIFDTL